MVNVVRWVTPQTWRGYPNRPIFWIPGCHTRFWHDFLVKPGAAGAEEEAAVRFRVPEAGREICGCGGGPKPSARDEEKASSLDGLGETCRKPLYLMIKTMVSGRFSLKPIQWQVFAGSWRKPVETIHSTHVEVSWIPRPRQENRRLRVENAELKKRLYFAGPYVGDLGDLQLMHANTVSAGDLRSNLVIVHVGLSQMVCCQAS